MEALHKEAFNVETNIKNVAQEARRPKSNAKYVARDIPVKGIVYLINLYSKQNCKVKLFRQKTVWVLQSI